MKTRVRFSVLLLAIPSAFAQTLSTPTTGKAPEPIQITIRRVNYAVDDAVRIVGVRLDGRYYDFAPNRALPLIATTTGWLDRLEIVFKNISPKTWVAGEIQVNCPSLNHGPREQLIIEPFIVGKPPERFPLAPRETNPPISVDPGQEVAFALGRDFYSPGNRLPQGGPFPDCTLAPMFFFFSDGTMWQPRQLFKPDPNSDHGYIRITPEEFGIEVPAQYRSTNPPQSK